MPPQFWDAGVFNVAESRSLFILEAPLQIVRIAGRHTEDWQMCLEV